VAPLCVDRCITDRPVSFAPRRRRLSGIRADASGGMWSAGGRIEYL